MNWLVTLEFQDGKTCTVEVYALDRYTAEYRAAVKAETVHKKTVSHVKKCLKSSI